MALPVIPGDRGRPAEPDDRRPIRPNEYEDRWRELSRAVCAELGAHVWKTWQGLEVQCSRCGERGTVTVTPK